MTEYDYSPDAIERFQAKMAGVGKWASDQKHYAPKYSNPFLPPDMDQASSSRSRTPVRQETYPQAQPRAHDRPQPARSRTLPAPVVTGASPGHGQTSRAYAYAQQSDHRAPRPSSSRTHHRSGSQPADSRYPYPTAVAPGAHQRASPYAAAPPPPPPGVRQVVMDYKYVPGQPIMLPQPRSGERYIVYAPPGGRVEVVDPRKTSSHSRSQSRSSGSKASSPTKKTGDPLFKRLITNLTPNIEWGDSSRSGRSSKRDGSRRRSASR